MHKNSQLAATCEEMRIGDCPRFTLALSWYQSSKLKDEVYSHMADVVPFPCIRPHKGIVHEVASLPYDVFNLAEAKEEIKKHPRSFLCIDMAEATFSRSVDANDDCVFEKARNLLDEAIADRVYVADADPHYYFYRLCTAEGQCQTGVVGCSSIDDYVNGVIKKHEKTRADKEVNRIRHVDTCSAQTGPIFLAFRSDGSIEKIMEKVFALDPLYDFTADDGVSHTVWRVDDFEDTLAIKKTFEHTESLYIADGHHRAASAVKAGLLRREAAKEKGKGDQPRESDHFLSVAFPSDQLTILDYNRVVSDLNGLKPSEFLKGLEARFVVSKPQKEPFRPSNKGSFGMYFDGSWYELRIKDSYRSDDPVTGLDVAILQDNLLSPLLGIKDPRTDDRIDFVGGIRGLGELERRVNEGMAVAFALFPTSIEELFAVADADMLMPPKSTWFEPKLRSGIFIHRI